MDAEDYIAEALEIADEFDIDPEAGVIISGYFHGAFDDDDGDEDD